MYSGVLALHDQGLGSWLHRRARTRSDRPAWSGEGAPPVTYAEAARRCDRVAHGLRRRGVGRGDRVAFLGPNDPAYLETLFATAAAGAVFVPLNTRLTAPELRFQLDDSGAALLVVAPGQDAVGLGYGPVTPDDLDDGRDHGPGTGPPHEPVGLDDPAVILYTSGTTGRPKGAVLTHGNLTWNAVDVLLDVDVRADERALVHTPLFHSAALGMVTLPVLLRGGHVALCRGFDAATVLRRVVDERITLMFGVPTTYDAVAALPGFADADLSGLRTLLCGGAPVPAATIRTWLARGLAFLQGYGMTEASPGVLLLDADHATSKAGSAGVPHFFTDVRVRTPGGTDAGPDERGEVLVRAPHVMAGYRGRPDDTAAAFDDGWVPRSVVFAASLPRTPSGKLRKNEIRERLV